MVMVKFGEKEFGMDGYLYNNLMEVKGMIKKDDDCVLVVDGRERAGKSVLALQVACALDPTFNLDRVAYNPKDFEDIIFKAEKYQCVILDEAMDIFYGKESQSWVNKYFNKLLAKIGQLNLIVILVLPSFFELDKYPSLHRSRVLLHIYTRRKQRGFFAFYNYSKKLKLYVKGKKFYDYNKPKPNFRGRFPNFYPIDEQEYRKKKAESLTSGGDEFSGQNIQRDWLIGYINTELNISQAKIAEMFEGCQKPLRKSIIHNICKKYKEGENNGERKRIGTDSATARRSRKEVAGATEDS